MNGMIGCKGHTQMVACFRGASHVSGGCAEGRDT
jgi:hypothetical protein